MQIMNINFCNLLDAQKFYEESLKNQRNRVNEHIKNAMEKGTPIVKLPFETYAAIDYELEELGWEYEQLESANEPGGYVASFHPVWYTDSEALEEDYKNIGEMISAADFYKSTLAKQKECIQSALSLAVSEGESCIKLPFMTYPLIDDEMEHNGWKRETWKPDPEGDEECVSYYPDCGF